MMFQYVCTNGFFFAKEGEYRVGDKSPVCGEVVRIVPINLTPKVEALLNALMSIKIDNRILLEIRSMICRADGQTLMDLDYWLTPEHAYDDGWALVQAHLDGNITERFGLGL